MLKDLLRLLRVPLAPTAACDSAACLLLALGAAGQPLAAVPGLQWAVLAATSLCLYGFGMGLNDWADRGLDRTKAPGRPLPSGRLPGALALGAVLALAAAGCALAAWQGTLPAALAALGAASAYNLGAKRGLLAGGLAMGLVRTANGALGVLPLVLAGTAPAWTLAAPACIGLWSAGATVLSTTEEHASLGRVRAARWLAALGIVGGCGLGMLAAGRVTLPGALLAPSLLGMAAGRLPKPGPPKRQVLEMLLGLYLLAGAIASGARAFEVDLGAPILAFVLIYLSQRMIFALRG
ncbi:MAG: UbiA family prenyltransferase [Planctomycetia bacterium]